MGGEEGRTGAGEGREEKEWPKKVQRKEERDKIEIECVGEAT